MVLKVYLLHCVFS